MLKYLSDVVLMAMRHELLVEHMKLTEKTNVYEYKVTNSMMSPSVFEKHIKQVQELEEQLKKLDKELQQRKRNKTR